MRYCPHCHRLNSGRPQLCHYCGHTWYIRLCPRGHENPPDAQYCGTCGSADLTETAGPVPFWIWLIRIGILVLLIVLIASLNPYGFRLSEQGIAYVVAIVILIMGLHVALSQLPGPIRRFVQSVIRIIKKVLVQVLGWCWEKLKLMFN